MVFDITEKQFIQTKLAEVSRKTAKGYEKRSIPKIEIDITREVSALDKGLIELNQR